MNNETGGILTDKQPKPLTHQSKSSGEVYKRPETVSFQLQSVLQLERAELLERLNIKNREDERFLLEETLIYLMREAKTANDIEVSEATANVLLLRANKLIKSRVWRIIHDKEAAKDCVENIVSELFGQLCDISTDKSDFAQVRFNMFVDKLIRRFIKRQQEQLKRNSITDSLDAPVDEESAPLEIEAKAELSYEDREAIKQALGKLPHDMRRAFVMRLEGYQIESKDPNEMTIAKYFGKTEKTIRNWLTKAEEILQNWRGGQN